MSARKDYPYPQDEFDVAGAAGGPEGVHRAERSTASKLAPWIVVLLVVPLISFGIVYWLSQNDSELGDNLFGDDEPAPTQPADGDDADGTPEDGGSEDGASEDGESEDGAAEEGASEDGEGDEEPEPEPEPEPAPVNRQASVRVLNATNTAGLAGVAAERVQADGFGTVAADNYVGGGSRAASVVKFSDPDLETTADQVAKVLGITDVEEDAGAGDGVVVELWTGLN